MLPAVDDSPLECIVWILKTIFSVIIETHCPIVGRKSYLANSLFKLNKQNVLAENLKRCNFKEAKICSIPDPSYCFFFKMGHSRPLFLYFRHFNAQLTVNKCSIYIYKFLPMTGFEPRISGIGSDHSTNWATTTSQLFVKYLFNTNVKIKILLQWSDVRLVFS